jgi:hypothetical protein
MWWQIYGNLHHLFAFISVNHMVSTRLKQKLLKKYRNVSYLLISPLGLLGACQITSMLLAVTFPNDGSSTVPGFPGAVLLDIA